MSSGHKFSCGLVLAGVLLSAVSCGGPGDSVEVTEVQTRSPYRPKAKLDASAEERFQYAFQSEDSQDHSGHDHGDAGDAGQDPAFRWDMPEGWQAVAPASMRPVNLRFGENSEGECYLTLLSGGGGGVFANLNRWCGQMGLEALTESEFEALPMKTLLGQDAAFLDIEGTFGGMGDSGAKENYRLLGIASEMQGTGVFVKMVGPAALVEANVANFDLFIGSLHVGEGGDRGVAETSQTSLPDGHPPISSAPVAAAPIETPRNDSADGIAWEVPEGWRKGGDRSMRLVTYTASSAECYITVLGGEGGGVLMNVNRWLAQFGQPEIDEDGLSALAEISIFGSPSALIEAVGSYGGMSADKAGGQALLGVIGLLDDRAVFVKMTGPEAGIAAEKERFISFCESLRLQ